MNEKFSRLYPHICMGLVGAWILWAFIPLAPASDPYGALKLLGFLFIEGAILIMGIYGLFLCYKKLLISELPLILLGTPMIHLLALMSPEHYRLLPLTLPLVIISVLAIITWKYR